MGKRCFGRLREENALTFPMMVSAMLRPLSSILSIMEIGKDFMFLRTRVNRPDPGAEVLPPVSCRYNPCRRIVCRSDLWSAVVQGQCPTRCLLSICICSTHWLRANNAKGGANSIEWIKALARGSANDRTNTGKEFGAPVGTEAACDFAGGGGGTQFRF